MKLHWALNSLLFILGVTFNGLLLLLVGFAVYTYAIQGYNTGTQFASDMVAQGPDKEIQFVLEEDTPIAEAAALLEEAGAVSNQYLFRLELFLKDSSTYYRAGTYTLNQSMNNTQVNTTMREPPKAEVVQNLITIPEGYSIRDIATYLEAKELMEASAFIEACANYPLNFSFLNDLPDRPNPLEGYLFPDTYYVSEKPEPEEIIEKMLTRFDQIFTDEYRYRAEELGLTLDEVITMASIIEKEVRVAAERPKVSQVIYNRLRIGEPLGMCSTVLYVLDKKRDRLLESDLTVESPYNTYINAGLPVGPIANPGADCIRAALYPEEGTLRWFVLQSDETGEHFFTDSYDAFLNAKVRYNQQF